MLHSKLMVNKLYRSADNIEDRYIIEGYFHHVYVDYGENEYINLKISEFKAAYVGQMQKYLAGLNEKVRLPDEKESIGLILCKSKNHEEVRFALAKTLSPVKVATYRTKLPDKKLIIKRLEQFRIKKYPKNY